MKQAERQSLYQSITWHENNLENMKHYHKQLKRAYKIEQERLDRLWNDIKTLEYQIESAKEEGKEKFDNQRYKKVKQ